MSESVSNGNLASFQRRLSAHVLDFAIFNGITYLLDLGIEALYYFLLRTLGRTELPLNQAVSFVESSVIDLVVTLLFAWFYYVMPQHKFGQTFAKKILKIQVIVEATGQCMSLKQSALRTAGYLISYLPFGCGFLMALFNSKKQALHDYFVGTITIRSEA